MKTALLALLFVPVAASADTASQRLDLAAASSLSAARAATLDQARLQSALALDGSADASGSVVDARGASSAKTLPGMTAAPLRASIKEVPSPRGDYRGDSKGAGLIAALGLAAPVVGAVAGALIAGVPGAVIGVLAGAAIGLVLLGVAINRWLKHLWA